MHNTVHIYQETEKEGDVVKTRRKKRFLLATSEVCSVALTSAFPSPSPHRQKIINKCFIYAGFSHARG